MEQLTRSGVPRCGSNVVANNVMSPRDEPVPGFVAHHDGRRSHHHLTDLTGTDRANSILLGAHRAMRDSNG
jgi:hypothetical protein